MSKIKSMGTSFFAVRVPVIIGVSAIGCHVHVKATLETVVLVARPGGKEQGVDRLVFEAVAEGEPP